MHSREQYLERVREDYSETADPRGRQAIQESLITGYRFVMWIAFALAVTSSASAVALDRPDRKN